MAEWKKFTGSEEQKTMLRNAVNGWACKQHSGNEIHNLPQVKCVPFDEIDEFMIYEPHPHAEMIHRWADTGQPVYKFSEYDNEWQLIAEPHWHRDTKYSFNPPKEKKFIEVRDYLLKTLDGEIFKATANKKFNDIKYIEDMNTFVRWLDDDWRKVEI